MSVKIYPSRPIMKDLLVMMHDSSVKVDAIIGYITDPTCGTERRSAGSEGPGFVPHARDPTNMLVQFSVGFTPLMLASLAGRDDVTKALLDLSADVEAMDTRNRTPLHIAAQYGHPSCAELLVVNVADLNLLDNMGRTPLKIAAQFGHASCIKLLVSSGSDVNSADTDGWTALHNVAKNNDIHNAEYLLARGADVFAVNARNRTALHYASRHDGAIAEMLVAVGAEVNAADIRGQTPLHIADSDGLKEVLIAEGADKNAVDIDGYAPVRNNIRFAHYQTRCAIFELLVESDTTVGALKAMAEHHLTGADDLCPMRYFDKWHCECQVGGLTRMMHIPEEDYCLMLNVAGLVDQSVVYLEGPLFTEGQADVGRAVAALVFEVRALKDEVRDLKAEVKANRLEHIGSQELLEDWSMGDSRKHVDVDQELLNYGNKPLRALWWVLKGEYRPASETKVVRGVMKVVKVGEALEGKRALLYERRRISTAMAIILDPRCGLDKRADLEDGPMNHEGFEINVHPYVRPSPLIIAIHARQIGVVRALLAAGADVEAGFCISVVYQKFGYVKEAKYEEVIVFGECTPLSMAATVELIDLLVSYGANVNNRLPLHQAAFQGRVDAMKALVGHGAKIHAVNTHGHTALHTAAAAVQKDALELLVNLGADVAKVDNRGYTALQIALSPPHVVSDPDKDWLTSLLTPKPGAPCVNDDEDWEDVTCTEDEQSASDGMITASFDANGKLQSHYPPLKEIERKRKKKLKETKRTQLQGNNAFQ